MMDEVKQPLVGIILLNYNGSKDTIACLDSLQHIEYSNYMVIVVDNKSTDDSEAVLRTYIQQHYIHEKVTPVFLQSGENRGFAAGNNVGIKYALDNGCEYVLLLNNDTLVKEDFLSHMVNACTYYDSISITRRGNTAFEMENHKIGMVTGKIYYESKRDTFWFAGGNFVENRFYGAHRGEGEVDNGQYDKRCQITFATGCLMLISKEAIESVGYLSEEYFMYYEDVDYCLRLREKGFHIVYCPEAVIYHKVSASTGGEASPFAIEWNTRNRIKLIRKYEDAYFHGDKVKKIKLKAFFYGTRMVVLSKYIATGKFKMVRALWKGLAKKGN